ncbi:MAG TPA: porin family protein [Chitinophagaceae bacterium]
MKKLSLSLGFCLIMVAALAQQRAGSGTGMFYFGGGPTFSTFTGDGADNASILVGAQVAMGVKLPLGSNFSIVPELNVGMQGTKWDVTPKQTFRLWYLNLPVLARYQFGQSGLFAETGPQIGLLLDAKRIIDDNKTDIGDSYKSTSVNWNFGLGYNINENLAINARVAPGLTDIDKSSTFSTKQFTSALRVTFGF